jgi:hypothetical protein
MVDARDELAFVEQLQRQRSLESGQVIPFRIPEIDELPTQQAKKRIG